MANLAAALNAEISRLARKELRASVDGLRKTISTQRAELSRLKKQVFDLERELRQLSRGVSAGRAAPPNTSADREEGGEANLRFRAAGMAANRKRLGLSAADFGLLVGASGVSVYQWEQGKTKPRRQYLAARGAGKREVAQRLAELKAKR